MDKLPPIKPSTTAHGKTDKFTPWKPRTMAELLPEISCLLRVDKNALTLNATKEPRPTIGITHTNGKVLKPMTCAEMKNALKCPQINASKSKAQMPASAKRKWNSSSELENKKVSHTAKEQLKHISVGKSFTFQPLKPVAPKSILSSRIRMLSSETPGFPKPERKAKKFVHFEDSIKSQIGANKENIPPSNESIVKKCSAINTSLHKEVLACRILETPISNYFRAFGEYSDASFLQNEVAVEPLYNIPEIIITVTTSSPFTKYRSATVFFDNLSDYEDTTGNTIMCFDDTVSKDDIKQDDMLSKAKMPTQNTCDIIND